MSEEERPRQVEELVCSDTFGDFVATVEKRPPNVFRIAGIAHRGST